MIRSTAVTALWRTYGTRGLWRRSVFETRRRLGRFKRAPTSVPLALGRAAPPAEWVFRPDRSRVRATADVAEGVRRADRVCSGEHQAFRWTWSALPATPRAWCTHPTTGHVYDSTVPWYSVAHLDPEAGDIKDLWEPARFGWAFDLARGWLLTGDDRHASAFWMGLETFLDGCPPFLGPQWSCGQETAIRAMAWLWMEGALADAPSSTPVRVARLREALAWSAERIADAIGYALSQRNNHGISEAAALAALGARFRGVHPRAGKWLALGRRHLEWTVRDQFAADGWYIQHSLNYLRLALDQVVQAERALRCGGEGLSPGAVARLRAAVSLLANLTDPATGDVPLHGANDGAYVLPLSTRGYRDYVPALTAAAATFHVPLPMTLLPDAETLAWLGADAPAPAPVDAKPAAKACVRSGSSGWVVATVGQTRLFARAGRYGSRPGHIDPLHVDVWIDGERVATDAGTFRYAAPPPWANGLADIEVHNTLSLPDHSAAVRGPRFLWFRWPSAEILEARVVSDDLVRVEMENRSWRDHGIVHRRLCEVSAHGVAVVDEVESADAADLHVRLHWLLDRGPESLSLTSSVVPSIDVVAGDESSVRGWISEGYAARRPGVSLAAEVRARGRVTLVTAFGDRRSEHGPNMALATSGASVPCST